MTAGDTSGIGIEVALFKSTKIDVGLNILYERMIWKHLNPNILDRFVKV